MHTISRTDLILQATRLHRCVYRSILEQTVDMAILVDPFGSVLYLNPSAERVMGPLRGETRTDALFATIHPDDVGPLRSALNDVCELKTPTVTVEYRARSAMGVWYVAEGVLQPLSSDGVQVVLLISRDVTIQRARQTQRSEGQAFEAAAQASGAVARDFGELLLSLGQQIDLLGAAAAAGAPLEMRAMRETIDGAWILVEQLQSFGRLNDLEPVHRVDVNETIAELASHHQRLAGKPLEVIHLLGASAPQIAMSRADLEELLSALVLRGRDAMLAAGLTRTTRDFAGAGRIAITTRDAAEVRSAAGLSASGGVVIEVADTGVAMSDEERTAIESGEPVHSDPRLERVHALVRKAGGRIVIESDAINGTTVRVLCPPAGARADRA